ncbi:trypsin-like peptidase domain-containing protein [Streptomyces sp. MS1.HAVA.3]|uniref:Trypsin-like peptidase domain-containing protein n=1 Tax=Streptomyces caledonius TaxID=3134107 RepID=A0ABU8UDB5_9ACTN
MKVQPSGAVLAAATVVLGVMAGPTAFADDMDPKKIYERAAPATVQVLGKYGDGTGFIYDAEKGLIATNAHVVQGEPSLKVKVGEQPPAPVRVVGIDPCADLAVLTFTSKPPDLKSLEFGESKELEVADTVTALGYPVGISETSQKVVYTAGSVQNPNVVNAEPSTSFPRYPSTIQHSATVNPGNSGGPLLDGQGKVVGINALTVTGATQGQSTPSAATTPGPSSTPWPEESCRTTPVGPSWGWTTPNSACTSRRRTRPRRRPPRRGSSTVE